MMEKEQKNTPTRGLTTDSDSNGGQRYELRPDWRVFLLQYAAGVLLAPVLVGIWVIMRYRRKWLTMRLVVTNNRVEHHTGTQKSYVMLHEITSCDVCFDGLPARFGLGTIRLHHDKGTLELSGIRNPEPVAVLIERAAETERDRMRLRDSVKKTRPAHASGTLEKKNELVGLWQQGLISEEDYQREMQKFQDA